MSNTPVQANRRMNALFSEATGYLVTESDTRILGGGFDSTEANYLELCHISDWEDVALSTPHSSESLLERVHSRRVTDDVLDLLTLDVPDDLASEVLERCESKLQFQGVASSFLARVLVAPLADLGALHKLIQLAHNLHAVRMEHSLSRVRDSQPLLRRFVHAWLSVPQSAFVHLGIASIDAWGEVVRAGGVLALIEATTSVQFRSAWLDGVIRLVARPGAAVVAWNSIRLELERILFPGSRTIVSVMEADVVDKIAARIPKRLAPLESIRAQISSIGDAVQKGDDARATRFLNELVKEQLKNEDREYVTKSLCNIAQRSADIFRFDFERLCLERALTLNPHDGWLLVQWGDHLKRIGRFDDALGALGQALENGGKSDVVISAMADVHAEKGDLETAERLYRSLPDWRSDSKVRTALADLARARGQYELAIHEYRTIRREWPGESRAVSGLAEAYKAIGSLDKAVHGYQDVMQNYELNATDRAIVGSGFARVRLLAKQPKFALDLVGPIIRETPFSTDARAVSVAAHALLGQTAETLWAAMSFGIGPIGESRSATLRGLVLMREQRINEALKVFGVEVADARARIVQRFALAQMQGGIGRGTMVDLEWSRNHSDFHVRMVGNCLRLHLLTRVGNSVEAEKLASWIEGKAKGNLHFLDLVKAVRSKRPDIAWVAQSNLLLALAA